MHIPSLVTDNKPSWMIQRKFSLKLSRLIWFLPGLTTHINNSSILKTWYWNSAQPTGVHYTLCVSPSVRPICFSRILSGTEYWLIYVHYGSCTLHMLWHHNWISASDFGTYHIGEQRMFMRVCAYAHTRLNLHFPQSIDVDERVRSKFRLLTSLDTATWAFIRSICNTHRHLVRWPITIMYTCLIYIRPLFFLEM